MGTAEGQEHWEGAGTLGMDSAEGQGRWEGALGSVGSPLGAGGVGQRLQEQQELMNNPGQELLGHHSALSRSLPILGV